MSVQAQGQHAGPVILTAAVVTALNMVTLIPL
jgi:hypothetical protein